MILKKNHFLTRTIASALSLPVALGLVASGWAATLTWTGAAGDNNASNAQNWSPAQAPVNGDVLIYARAVGLAPQLSANLTVGTITFSNTAGAFTLGGAGIYTVNNGITNNSVATETINNAIKLGANQNWNAATGKLVVGGAVNLQTFTLSNTGTMATTISGNISGAGGVTQSGSGSLTLSGNNTYSGTTLLSAGTLNIGSDTALGTGILVFDGGTLAATGGARTLGNAVQWTTRNLAFNSTDNLTLNGTVAMTAGIRLTIGNTGVLTLNGVLSGNNRNLRKLGTGTLILNGANTFSGGLDLRAGTTIVGSNTAAGTNAGTLVLQGGAIQAGGAARTLANPVSIGANTAFTGAYDLTFSGATDLTNSWILAVQNPTTTFTGIVSGGATLTKAGAGILTLGGLNTYSGGTIIQNGTVVLNSNTAAGANTGTITVGDALATSTTPASLLFSTTGGRTVANPIIVPVGSTGLRTIGGLNTTGVNTYNGTVALATSATLTAAAGGEVNFNGVMSGAGGITKTGAGIVRLSKANLFTGATLVSQGTLAYGIANALSGGAVTVNGGTLDMGAFTDTVGAVLLENGSITGTATSLLTGTSLTVRNGTVTARLGGAIPLTKDTAGTVTLSGANTYTGGTNINAGTLVFGAANVLANTGAVNVNGGTLSIGAFSDTVGAVTLASGSILGTSGVLTGTGYTLQSGTVTAALGGAAINLTKTTTGIVLISGANAYTGTTTISAGTLRIGATETLPDSSATDISAGATLDMNNLSDTVGSLAGAGNLLLGSGRLTSGGNNTSTTFTGAIGGSGGISKAGTGTLTLGGVNAYSGSTDVNAGTLTLGNAAAGPSASRVNVATGATFNTAGFNTAIGSLAGAGNVTLGAGTLTTGGDMTSSAFSGVMSGTGGLTKAGAGTMTLTGTNTLTGTLTVTGGALTLAGTTGRAASAASVSVRTGASLILDNTAGENLDRIGNATAINIQGGDLRFISDANGSTETVGSLNFLLGPSNVTVVHNGTALQSTALTFSALGSVVTGTSLNFSATGGTLGADVTGPHIYITGQAQGILGSWARVGADFAEYGAHGVRAFSNYYTGALGINVNDPTKIVLLSATSPLGAYTLTNAGTTNDGGLSITNLPLVDLGPDATRALNLVAGGLIKSGLPDSTISGAGRLTAGGTAAGAFNMTVDSGSRLTSASNIIDNAGADGIYGNAGDGSVGLVKAGLGTLALTGTNSFSGGVYANEGFIEVGKDANLGAAGNDVTLSGGGLRAVLGFTAGTGRRFVVTAGLSGALDVSAGQALTITGASDLFATGDATSRLVKSGAGDLVLGAANPNFTGTLEITGGAAELRDAGSLGTGTIALNGGALRLRADASTLFSNPFQLLANSTIEAAPITAGTPVLSLGAVTIGSQILTVAANGGATLALAGANLTGDATFNATAGTTTLGAIAGAYGFTKTGTGILQLSGPGAYSGTTNVQAGTLRLSNSTAIPLTSLVTVGAAGTVDANSLPVNFGTIAGTGSITLGTGTLTIGGNLTPSTFGGVISGAGGLTKIGSETLTLSGANTFTGTTTILVGNIQLAANNSLPAATTIAITAGASLDLAGYNQTAANVTGSGTVALGAGTLTVGDANDSTFAGDFTGTGRMVKAGTGKLSVSGASTHTGTISVAAGTLEVLSPTALGTSAGGTSIASGAKVTLASGIAITSEPLTIAGAGPTGTGALELPTGTASWDGPITLSLGATIGSSGTLTLGGTIALAGSALTFIGTGDTLALGIISGAGSITKTGTGTLTLDGVNTLTGTTTVSAGTLRVQDGTALGTTGAGNEATVESGATLLLDSVTGVSSNKAILIAGAGVLSAGSIHATGGVNMLAGDITMTANSTVNVDTGASLALGAIGGLGLNLTKAGDGILSLIGANTFTGILNATAGTVSIGGDNRFAGLSGLTLAAGTTLDLNDFSDSLGQLSGAGTISYGATGGGSLSVGANGVNTTFSGILSGTGKFAKIGTGTLTFATSNAIPSTVTVTVNGGGALALGTANQTTGAVVVLSGSITGTTATLNAPSYELHDSSVSARLAGTSSTLLVTGGYSILTATNPFTGSTQITDGTLEVGVSGSLSGTSSVNVSATGTLHDLGIINSAASISGILSGTGTITGNVAILTGGALSPATGTTVGTFATGPLSFASGATYELTLSSGTSTADKTLTTGSITLGAGIARLVTTDTLTAALLPGTMFAILESTISVTGTFAGMPEGSVFIVGPNTYQISYLADSARDVTLTVVPEPSQILLLLAGLTPIVMARSRRRASRA